MSASVDVLAVMDREVNRLVCAWHDAAPGDTGPEPPTLQAAREARSAVAKLIAERDRLANIVRDHEAQILRMTAERAELIEADRWRDPIAEPAEHRQRVLVAYEAGRHVVVGAAVRWLHTPGDHDSEDEWELADSSYVVKVLAWRPMPEFDRAALARCGGAP